MSDLQHWEARYETDDYIFGTGPNVFLASQADRLRPGLKALSIADGEGRNGVWLAEQGLDVLSIDFSPAALRKAQALAAARGVTLQTEQADLSDWRWPEAAFDVVAAIFIQFADPPARDDIFAGIKHTLKPGGLLFMQGYRPEQMTFGTGGPRSVERCYTRALLERSFAAFSSIEITEHETVLAEGCWHVGKSALIDLVARK
jgi:2-polyprenyl-3-methyl-5-hydroxy-6-metoxy-1,4-benzoquinol methylase